MKTYMKPSLKVVEIENQAILAGSDPEKVEAGAGSSTGTVGAKNGFFFDDED